jgi:ribosomal protein S18 acetylase RimI-like enzyme
MNVKIRYDKIKINHISSIIELLLERQENEKRSFNFLEVENHVDNLHLKLQELFKNHRVSGVVAFYNNSLVGYLFGEIISDDFNKKSISVSYEGVAIKKEYSYELLKQLYTEAAKLWVEIGCFVHSIYVPLGDKSYLEAFQHLSFAIEQVHAVLIVDEYENFACDYTIGVRRANHDDRQSIKSMSNIILKTHNDSPTFSKIDPGLVSRIKQGYESLVDGSDIINLAFHESKIVGFHVYEILQPSLMKPSRSLLLEVSATHPDYKRLGIGKRLMNEGVKLSKEMKYQYILVDWKVSNLSASSFWEKCGFAPIVYRLTRKIDNDYYLHQFDDID